MLWRAKRAMLAHKVTRANAFNDLGALLCQSVNPIPLVLSAALPRGSLSHEVGRRHFEAGWSSFRDAK
jgi:hypothetical protein